MIHRKVSALLAVAAVLGVLVRPAGAAPAARQNSAPAVIKIGGIFAKTGSASVVANPILAGYEIAFKQVNRKGGINGRRIDYITENDNYDPSRTLPAVRHLVEEDRVVAFAGIFGSDDSNQAIPYLDSQHIPFFDPIGGGADVAGKRWVWQTEPEYSREGKVIAQYAIGKLHPHSVAVLYQVGANEPELTSIKALMQEAHVNVAAVPYHATDVDMSPALARVRQSNPDLVILTGTLIPTSSFIRLATATGYKPPLGYFANYPQGDPTWVGLTSGGAEGSLVSSYADLTGHNSVARSYRTALKRFGGTYSNYGLYGYFNAGLLMRAIKLAGSKLTRARLQRVLDTDFHGYKPGLTGTLEWTSNYHYGVTQFKIYRIRGTSFVPVTGWLNS